MSTKTIQIIKGIVFLVISLYLTFTFNDSLSNFVAKISVVGWVMGSIILRVVLSLAFARGVQLTYKGLFPSKRPILVFSIGVLVGFTVSFFAQPIYNVDYGHYGNSKLTLNLGELRQEVGQELSLNNENALIIFFSTDCSTCIEMSNKIGHLQEMGNTPQIIALFSGEETDAIKFLNTNKGTKFKYYMVNDFDYFLESADYSFPSLFLVDKNGEAIQHWEGTLVNYSAFDLINTYK